MHRPECWVDYGNELRTLTLHGTRITGTIPSDLKLADEGQITTWKETDFDLETHVMEYSARKFPKPFTLTLSDTKLEGAVPDEVFAHTNTTTGAATNTTLLLSNNRLSCGLPTQRDFSASQKSVILTGNRFSKPVPHWSARRS